MEPKPRSFPLYLQILLATGLGLLVGPVLGERAATLGELGRLVIQLIKAVAAPLLFFAIVNAIVQSEVQGRSALRLLFWASVNASVALLIGLSVSNLFQPGRSLAGFVPADPAAIAKYESQKIDLIGTLDSFAPKSMVAPFAENLVLTIAMIAVLFGVGLRRVRSVQIQEGRSGFRAVQEGIETLYGVMIVVLGWVVRAIPFGVFGVVAKAVGEHGYAPLKGLGVYVLVGLGGLLIHILLTYQLGLILVAKLPLRRFWQAAREPVFYAAGANSSLATLPVTLSALDRLGISRRASALGACVATNFNNDGIILYEGMAVLFVAQASGLDLTVSQQLLIAATCMIAAMGVAGVPEAGFVSLALVLNTAGLPIAILPLLLSVDWIIARGRSVTNVLSDMVLSILIDSDSSSRRQTSTGTEEGPRS